MNKIKAIIGFLTAVLLFIYAVDRVVYKTEIYGAVSVQAREWVTAYLYRERGQRITQRLPGLEVTFGDSKVPLDGRIDIFFRSTRAGTLSLWNRNSQGVIKRIYPPFSRTRAVDADETWARRLRAEGSPGQEGLYVVWTSNSAVHAFGEEYPNRNAFLGGVQEGTGRPFSEVLIQFELEIL